MVTLQSISTNLASLAAGVTALAGNPSVPFTADDSPALVTASNDTLGSKAYVDTLLGRHPKLAQSGLDSCDHELSVALAMVSAVNAGTPASLTRDGVLHQIGAANTMARALG